MDPQYIAAWGCFLLLVLALLAFDLFVLHRHAHEIRFREALLGTLAPVVCAAICAVLIYFAYEAHYFHLGIQPAGMRPIDNDYYPDTGAEAALLFVTGYLVELSLSADNVFLFVVLMRFFAVPPQFQHRVLFWGVLGALLMRAAMILGGAALLAQFSWVIYVFGVFLLFTGIKMSLGSSEDADPSRNLAVRIAKRFLPFTDDFHGHQFIVRLHIAGTDPPRHRYHATTLLLVLIAIEFTDLVFAVDSIPAIFGITKDPFIVFTSNVFAILGLRSMYFLLAGVMDRFYLLRYGLAFILTFVGVKMLLPGLGDLYHWLIPPAADVVVHPWHINKFVALAVIIFGLAASILGSLIWPARHPVAAAPRSPSDVPPNAP